MLYTIAVIHRKKVEIDDATQYQQNNTIQQLTNEKTTLSQLYTENLQILEESLDIINNRDSEILDLKLLIQTLQYEINSSSKNKELEVSEFDDSERPASITKNNNINKKRIPSPPQSKPSRAYSSSSTNSIYNSNHTTNSGGSSTHNIHRNNIEQIKAASFAAVRRTSTSNLKLASTTSTVDIVDNSYCNTSGSSSGEEKGLASDCDIDEDDEPSPIGDIKINRMKVTRLEKTRPPLQHQQQMLSSSSTTNTTSTTSTIPTTTSGTTTTTTTLADQKASALSKYRQYVALNTTSSNKNNTSNNTITNNSSSGNSSNCSSTTSLTAPKWSDIGKHDKLFQKVDLNTPETLSPKSRPPYTKHSNVTDKDYSQFNSTYNKHSTTTTAANTLYTAVDDESSSMHDSVEYIPDQGEYSSPPRGLYTALSHITTASTSTTNKSISQQYTPSHLNDSYNSANNSDTVEVFVLSDSSNPPSPARSKPNRPIFKPPYSKPVFNEFTPNKAITTSSSGSNTNTSTTSGNNSSNNYKTTTTPTTTTTTTTNNKVIKKEYPSHTNFPSKEKFNAYVSQRGSAYFTDKDNNNNSDEEKSVDYNTTTITTNNNTSTTSSNNKYKNVQWLDTKESNLATSYHESTVGVRENDSFVGMEMLYYVYIVYTIYYILYTECMFYICIYICIVYIYVQYI